MSILAGARRWASALAPSGLRARSGERLRSFGPVRAVGQAHSLLRACMWHPYAIGQQRAHGTRQPRGPVERMRSPDLDWLVCAARLFLPATPEGWQGGPEGLAQASPRRSKRLARSARLAACKATRAEARPSGSPARTDTDIDTGKGNGSTT